MSYKESETKPEDQHVHGRHETQESKGGEADLPTHLQRCKKNPGHHFFISVQSFQLNHLPADHRNHDLYELIKATADLTVKISVRIVSPLRPDFWLGTNDPYPFFNKKGCRHLRTGSGEISVFKYVSGHGYNGRGSRQSPITGRIYESEYQTCPCEQCRHSPNPSDTWWQILVYTSAHVVFDDIEASHTTCWLFYDGENTSPVTLDNGVIDSVDIERDKCQLKYVTCLEIGKTLYEIENRWGRLWQTVYDKYRGRADVRLTFIVSHPHGGFKQISIGHWVSSQKVKDYNSDFDYTKLTYTTCTCPGSSGARVYCVGYQSGHVHTGSFDGGLNYSGFGYIRKSVQ